MKKLLLLLLVSIFSCAMPFDTPKGDQYVLTNREKTVITDLFGAETLQWATNNTYWGDIDSTAKYYWSSNIILMNDEYKDHAIAFTLVHEIVHHFQMKRDGMYKQSPYAYTPTDLRNGNLGHEQEAEVVRFYALNMYKTWEGQSVAWYGNKFYLNSTTASHIYKVLNGLGITVYKKPTFRSM